MTEEYPPEVYEVLRGYYTLDFSDRELWGELLVDNKQRQLRSSSEFPFHSHAGDQSLTLGQYKVLNPDPEKRTGRLHRERWIEAAAGLGLIEDVGEVDADTGATIGGLYDITAKGVAVYKASLVPSVPPAEEPKSAPAEAPKARAGKAATVEERLSAMLFQHPETMGWSATQFAGALGGCTDGAVKQTKAWKKLMEVRALQRADRKKGLTGK